MSLYLLSLLVLVLGVVLSIVVFLGYRKRLTAVDTNYPVTMEGLKAVFNSTPVEQGLGYGLIAAIAYLIWQTIQQGFDFALLMIGATVFTGIVWLVDLKFTKKAGQQLFTRVAIISEAVYRDIEEVYGRDELRQLVAMLTRLREVAEALPDLPRIMPDLP